MDLSLAKPLGSPLKQPSISSQNPGYTSGGWHNPLSSFPICQRFLKTLPLFLLLFLPRHTLQAVMDSSQCAVPPFVSEGSVKPNIFLLLDNSGSMNEEAWSDNLIFDQTREYYGYFDPYRCYKFQSNKFQTSYSTTATVVGPNWTCNETANGGYPFSGNFMNWAYMTRLEVMKKALVGGRWNGSSGLIQGEDMDRINPADFCVDPAPYTPLPSGAGVHLDRSGYNLIMQTVSTCNPTKQGEANHATAGNTHISPTLTYAFNIDTPLEPTGLVLEMKDQARWAAGIFNFDQGGRVIHYYGFNVAGGGSSLVNTIRTLNAPNWTPSSESFYEMVRYHIQAQPYFNSNDYNVNIGGNRDPFFEWEGANEYVPCRKTFLLFVTDGKPTQDQGLPANLNINTPLPGNAPSDYDGDALDTPDQVNAALPLPGWPPTCSGDFSLICPLFQQPNNVGQGNGSAFLDDVAFWARTNDLRPGSCDPNNPSTWGVCIPGIQNIISYFVFTFGDVSATGYERSAPWTLWNAAIKGGFEDKNGNNRPDLTSEWDENGDGVPDTFFFAQDGNDIENAIRAAVLAILRRTSSGTSVAILSQSEEGEGSVYQAYFHPRFRSPLDEEVSWVGFLRGLWMDRFGNLREDRSPSGPPGDAALTLNIDRIIKYRFDPNQNETFVDLYNDLNGDGVTDSGTPSATVKISDLSSTFEAGKILFLTHPDLRTIFSQLGGVRTPFTASNALLFAPYLNITDTPSAVTDLINYIRGTDISGWRSRTLTLDGLRSVWKLGDIIYSTPTVVGAPPDRYDKVYGDASYAPYYERYKDRRNIVVAGANDGMLHAFNAGFFMNGNTDSTPQPDEAWYDPRGIPLGQELWGWIPFNSLPHLKWLKEEEYCHVFYVDLAPRIVDLPIYVPDVDHPNGWGTTLVGGMGLGCKTVTVGANTFRSSIFILDITNPDSASFPKPILEYNDPALGFTTSQPIVARVNTDSGLDYWYIIFGSGPTTLDYTSSQPAKLYVLNLDGANSKILSLPGSANEYLNRGVAVDVDHNYNVDVIYIASSSGKIYRIVTRANPGDQFPDPNPQNWKLSVLYSGAASITTSPRFALDDAGNKWIYIGTGRYLTTWDKTNTTTQYFLGIKDPCWDGSCNTTFTLADLYQISQSCVLDSSGTMTGCGLTPQQIANNVAAKKGWYIAFTNGERVVTRAVVSNKAVFFTTFKPINSPCSGGGTSRLWPVAFDIGVILAPPVDLGVGVAQIAKTSRGLITQLSTGALGQPSTGLYESDPLTGLDFLAHPFSPPAGPNEGIGP